jgi:hypothetical protein
MSFNRLDHYIEPFASQERLIKEYEKHGSLTIGFDFDGTVHDFHKVGASYEMVVNLLRDLKAINCKLICWSCFKDHDYIAKYLTAHNIPFDGINTDGITLPWQTRKPFFNALLDDRAGLSQVYYELKFLLLYLKLKNTQNDKGNSGS